MIEMETKRRRTYLRNCRILVFLCALAAASYLRWLVLEARPDTLSLFTLLFVAEVFNMTQAAGFWYTISVQSWNEPPPTDFSQTRERVDVFITVCGEPVSIVERTVAAAAAMKHPRLTVWILDDDPSPDIANVAWIHRAKYLTRPDRKGAKAGNINHALARTEGDFVVVFDADHAPLPEFLESTMGGFSDPAVAFVQTPQYYRNRTHNRVAAGANEQQGLFYGPILRGKNSCGAVFSCGTNVVFRRDALEAVGGMPEDSITEDLRISLMLIREGYKSVYVPRVLAEGLGPVDVAGFFSQQMRWARGGLEILFTKRPFTRRMSGGQAIQYALSFIYWFTGWAYAAYVILPILFLILGLRPIQVPNRYPVFFLPYAMTTLFTMAYATDFRMSFRAIWFTLASFPIHIAAFFAAIFGRAASFIVTPKTASGRSLRPARVHIAVVFLLAECIFVGLWLHGPTPSVLNNVAFAMGHILLIHGFIRLAWNPDVPGTVQPPPDLATPFPAPGPAPERADRLSSSAEEGVARMLSIGFDKLSEHEYDAAMTAFRSAADHMLRLDLAAHLRDTVARIWFLLADPSRAHTQLEEALRVCRDCDGEPLRGEIETLLEAFADLPREKELARPEPALESVID